MTLALRIQKRRLELGMSQKELAAKSGLNPPSISQYENNTRIPKQAALEKLASALEISELFLLKGIVKADIIYDRKDEALWNLIRSFNPEEKEKVLDYARYIEWKNLNEKG